MKPNEIDKRGIKMKNKSENKDENLDGLNNDIFTQTKNNKSNNQIGAQEMLDDAENSDERETNSSANLDFSKSDDVKPKSLKANREEKFENSQENFLPVNPGKDKTATPLRTFNKTRLSIGKRFALCAVFFLFAVIAVSIPTAIYLNRDNNEQAQINNNLTFNNSGTNNNTETENNGGTNDIGTNDSETDNDNGNNTENLKTEFLVTLQYNVESEGKQTIKLNRGSTLADIERKQINGYCFVGFYQDPDHTIPLETDTQITEDTTIYLYYVQISYKFNNIPSGLSVTINNEAVTTETSLAFGDEVEISYTLQANEELGEFNVSGLEKIENFTSITSSDGSTTFTAKYKVVGQGLTTSEESQLSIIFTTTDSILTYEKSTEYDGFAVTGFADGYIDTENLIIPSTHHGQPVVEIGENAFFNCANLNSIIIPESIKSVGESAFENCYSLMNVTIESSYAYGQLTDNPNSCGCLGAYAYTFKVLKTIDTGNNYLMMLPIQTSDGNYNIYSIF